MRKRSHLRMGYFSFGLYIFFQEKMCIRDRAQLTLQQYGVPGIRAFEQNASFDLPWWVRAVSYTHLRTIRQR